VLHTGTHEALSAKVEVQVPTAPLVGAVDASHVEYTVQIIKAARIILKNHIF
jgi:hypothetical protein